MDYEIMVRFLLAALWGGIVGAEREYRSKSAGFRTMIMISMGSCFFTMMSEFLGNENNPDRIASNIVTGIGFLGAGVIFRGDNKVNGITTAATIWAVAAVGMGIGGGHYFASACASVLILIVLAILPYIENLIDNFSQTRLYILQCPFTSTAKDNFEKIFLVNGLKCRLVKEIKDEAILITNWQVQGHSKKHKLVIATLENDHTIQRFEY